MSSSSSSTLPKPVLWMFWIVTMGLAFLYNVTRTTTMTLVCGNNNGNLFAPLSSTTSSSSPADAVVVPATTTTTSNTATLSRSTSTSSTPPDDEFDDSYDGPQTTYAKYPHPFPCWKEELDYRRISTQKSPTKEGILYTREMKTGSSTFAGVLLGLAARKGQQVLGGAEPEAEEVDEGSNSNEDDEDGSDDDDDPPPYLLCKHRVDHKSASKMQYGQRDKSRSIHVSMLRHPTKRILSHFFHFHISFQKMAPTDSNFRRWLRSSQEVNSNYYTKDLSLRANLTASMLQKIQQHPDFATQLVQEILDEYDFIAITERLDESLVVLKHLLELDSLEEILYVSAKTAGSFNKGPYPQEEPCVYLIPSFVTPGMKDYFESPSWTEQYMGMDLLLYKAAVQSLDNTIDALGREEIQLEVQEFNKMLSVAQTMCANQTQFRCDKAGNFVGQNNTCLLWGVGCGHDCLEGLRNNSNNNNNNNNKDMDWDAMYKQLFLNEE